MATDPNSRIEGVRGQTGQPSQTEIHPDTTDDVNPAPAPEIEPGKIPGVDPEVVPGVEPEITPVTEPEIEPGKIVDDALIPPKNPI